MRRNDREEQESHRIPRILALVTKDFAVGRTEKKNFNCLKVSVGTGYVNVKFRIESWAWDNNRLS